MFNIDAPQRFQEGYARGSQRRLGQTIAQNGMAAGRNFALSRGMLDAGMALDQQIRGEEAGRAAAEAEREQTLYDRSVDQRDYQLRALEFAHQQDMDQLRFAYQQTQDAAERERLEEEMGLRREEFQFAVRQFEERMGLERSAADLDQARFGLEVAQFDRENEQYMDEMETEEQVRAQELRSEMFDVAVPQIADALRENQGNPEGFRDALGRIAGQMQTRYPTMAAEIATEVNQLAQTDMETLDFMLPVITPDQTESERLIADLQGRNVITQEQADELRQARAEYIAGLRGRPGSGTTINVPGITGYDEQGRPIQALQGNPAQNEALRNQSRAASMFNGALRMRGAVENMSSRRFGVVGGATQQASSIVQSFFGSSASDEVIRLMTGEDISTRDFEKARSELTAYFNRSIAAFIAQEDINRLTDKEIEMAQTAFGLGDAGSREAVMAALEEAAVYFYALEQSSYFLMGRTPPRSIIREDGTEDVDLLESLDRQMWEQGIPIDRRSELLDDLMEVSRNQWDHWRAGRYQSGAQ